MQTKQLLQDVKEISKKHNLDGVIILAIKDFDSKIYHLASYGRNKGLCNSMKVLGGYMMRALDYMEQLPKNKTE